MKTENNKLIQIQSLLKAPKNQRNNFGNYDYRSCEDILEALKPLLLEHRGTLTISDEIFNIGNRFYVKAIVKLILGDAEYISTAYAREEENKKGMDGSQITGSASSYARKYALNGLFLIDDTKDSDYLNIHDKQEKEEKPKRENGIIAETFVDFPIEEKKAKSGSTYLVIIINQEKYFIFKKELADIIYSAKENENKIKMKFSEKENSFGCTKIIEEIEIV